MNPQSIIIKNQFATTDLQVNKKLEKSNQQCYQRQQGQTEFLRGNNYNSENNQGTCLDFLDENSQTQWDRNFTIKQNTTIAPTRKVLNSQKQSPQKIDIETQNINNKVKDNIFEDDINEYLKSKQKIESKQSYRNLILNNDTNKQKNRSISLATQPHIFHNSSYKSQQNYSYKQSNGSQQNGSEVYKLPDIQIQTNLQENQEQKLESNGFITKKFNMTNNSQNENWRDQINKINNAPWKIQTPKTTMRNKIQNLDEKSNKINYRTSRNFSCQITSNKFHHQKYTQAYQHSTFYNREKLQELKFGNEFYQQKKNGKFDFGENVYEKNQYNSVQNGINLDEQCDAYKQTEGSINPFELIMKQKYLNKEEKNIVCKKIQNINQINRFKDILQNNQIQHNELKRQIANNKQELFYKRYKQDIKIQKKLHLVEGKMVEKLEDTIKNNFTFQVRKMQQYKKFLQQDDDENKKMVSQIKQEVKNKLLNKERENVKIDAMISLQNQTYAYLKGGKINNPELIRQIEQTQQKLQEQHKLDEKERQEQIIKRQEYKKINEKFSQQMHQQQLNNKSISKSNHFQPNQDIINHLQSQLSKKQNLSQQSNQDKSFISSPNTYYEVDQIIQTNNNLSSSQYQIGHSVSIQQNGIQNNFSLQQNVQNSINPSQIYYHGLPNIQDYQSQHQFQYDVSQMSNYQTQSINKINQSTSSFGEKNKIEVDIEQTDQARRAGLYMKLLKGIYEQAQNKPQVVKDRILAEKMREYWKVNSKGQNNTRCYKDPDQVKVQFKRIRTALSNFFFTLSDKKIQPHEIIQNMGTNKQVFMSKPYERPGSFVFFKQLRKGNLEIVLQKINSECRYYIFDKDHYLQTALHIALNRGFNQLSHYLINLGSDLSSKDLAGRTPLYYALKNGNFKLAQLMLFQKASPWAETSYSYENLINGDEKMTKVLKEAKKIHLVLKFVKGQSERVNLWEQKRFDLLEMEVDDKNVSPRTLKLNLEKEIELQNQNKANEEQIKIDKYPQKNKNILIDDNDNFDESDDDSDMEKYIKLQLDLKTEEDKNLNYMQEEQN